MRPGGAALCFRLRRRCFRPSRPSPLSALPRPCSAPPQSDGRHRSRYRDRQLCTDRADWPAPAVGERPRFPALVARRDPTHHAHDHITGTIMAIITTRSPWAHACSSPSRPRGRSVRLGPCPRTGAAGADRRHWLRRGLAAIVAVGLRPCSGAIIVLVFALAQGLFWIGVASTFVMGIGTAITVAAIATLAVGARGLAGRLAKAKPGAGMILSADWKPRRRWSSCCSAPPC